MPQSFIFLEKFFYRTIQVTATIIYANYIPVIQHAIDTINPLIRISTYARIDSATLAKIERHAITPSDLHVSIAEKD